VHYVAVLDFSPDARLHQLGEVGWEIRFDRGRLVASKELDDRSPYDLHEELLAHLAESDDALLSERVEAPIEARDFRRERRTLDDRMKVQFLTGEPLTRIASQAIAGDATEPKKSENGKPADGLRLPPPPRPLPPMPDRNSQRRALTLLHFPRGYGAFSAQTRPH
jgi:hypothetical protein